MRQVSKEKKIQLQPILLEQTFGVTHLAIESLIALARFKSMNLLVERAKRLQGTQSSRGSRFHRPPPFGASKLNVMCFIKPKVEPCSGRSTSQSFLKSSSSSLRSRKMFKSCSLENISKVSMLVSKQTCIRTLKEQVENIPNDMVQREGEQRRAHVHVDNKEVIHLKVKNDLDMVKVNLEKTLCSCESISELAVS
jgi:superfamily II helicase